MKRILATAFVLAFPLLGHAAAANKPMQNDPSTSGIVVQDGQGMSTGTTSIVAASVSGTILTASVSGQPLVTLTSGATAIFAAGSNITLTTDNTAKTITIAASGGSGTVTSVSLSGGTTGFTWAFTNSQSAASGTMSAGANTTLSALTVSSISNSGTLSNSGAATLASTLVVAGTSTHAALIATTTTVSSLSNSGTTSLGGNLTAGGPVSYGTTGVSIVSIATAVSSTSHHILILDSNSARTFTLSPGGETGREYLFYNVNSGALTISASGGQATTILSAAGALTSSFTIASNSSGIRVISDGTWWLAK